MLSVVCWIDAATYHVGGVCAERSLEGSVLVAPLFVLMASLPAALSCSLARLIFTGSAQSAESRDLRTHTRPRVPHAVRPIL